MAYDIGPRIGIQGEAEFNKQIKQINNALRECGSEMKALSSEFDENANSQDALVAKNKNLQKELDLQRQKMGLLEDQYEKQVQKLEELRNAYQQAAAESGKTSKEAQKAENAFNKQADEVSKLGVAMNETQNYINKFNNSISKNDRMLDEIESGARDAATGLSLLDESAKGASDSLSGIEGKLDAGNMMDAADAISAVGDKIIEAGGKSVDAFSDLEGTVSRVNSYFGLTGDAADKMGEVVENVFRTGVTDSLEEVGEAVILVNNNLKDLDPSQLENIAAQAINLEKVFGSDISETMRGVNALMVNFGLDAQTAMDYIVAGSQNGLDKTQELGDNLSEYSGKFAQAGYSAQEYFQLLQNGLEGGAYNLDKVNDSINEVTTRLSDGTIEEALGSFSENTQKTFEAWKNGGATQKDVINSIVDDIREASSQQEALNLASTAFGTLGEDANMQVVTSLTTLGDEYDNVAGKAEKMSEDSTTPMQKLQSAVNDLQLELAPFGEKLVELATEVLPPVVDFISGLLEGFLSLPGPVQNLIGVIAGAIAVFSALAPIISAVGGIISVFGTVALGPIAGIIAGIIAAITAVILVVQNWGTITEWLGDVAENIFGVLQDGWEAVTSFISGMITGISNTITGAWNRIKDTINSAMQAIQDTISNVWTDILENPVVQAIVSTVSALFQNMSNTMSNIWENVKNIASAAWELIKNVILGPVLLLIDLVLGDFDQLKTDAKNIWNNIKNAASTIWNGIMGEVSSIAEGMTNAVRIALDGLCSAASGIWDSMKNAASTAWDAIRNTVSNIASSAKDAAVNAFHAMVSGIANAMGSIGSVVSNGFQSAIDFIRNLPGQAIQWGRDFINGLADGIMSGVNKIVNSVKDIANKIRSFLHFSRPDEGPLRDYEKWMPDFITGLANGIYNNLDEVEKAASAVSGTIDSTITGKVADMSTPTAMRSTVIKVDGDTMILDGKIVGKTAAKYINVQQAGNAAAKGQRPRYV